MNLRTCLVAALLVAAPVSAIAAPGMVRNSVNLRAGPGAGFPVVDRIPAGARVTIHGCLSGGAWCDVSFAGERGWVAVSALAYLYQRRYVYLPDYVDDVPVTSFALSSYWGSYYVGRPWYRRHAHWNHYWHQHRPPALAHGPRPHPHGPIAGRPDVGGPGAGIGPGRGPAHGPSPGLSHGPGVIGRGPHHHPPGGLAHGGRGGGGGPGGTLSIGNTAGPQPRVSAMPGPGAGHIGRDHAGPGPLARPGGGMPQARPGLGGGPSMGAHAQMPRGPIGGAPAAAPGGGAHFGGGARPGGPAIGGAPHGGGGPGIGARPGPGGGPGGR